MSVLEHPEFAALKPSSIKLDPKVRKRIAEDFLKKFKDVNESNSHFGYYNLEGDTPNKKSIQEGACSGSIYYYDKSPIMVIASREAKKTQEVKEKDRKVFLEFLCQRSGFAPLVLNRDDIDEVESGPIIVDAHEYHSAVRAFSMMVRFLWENTSHHYAWKTFIEWGCDENAALAMATQMVVRQTNLVDQSNSYHGSIFNGNGRETIQELESLASGLFVTKNAEYAGHRPGGIIRTKSDNTGPLGPLLKEALDAREEVPIEGWNPFGLAQINLEKEMQKRQQKNGINQSFLLNSKKLRDRFVIFTNKLNKNLPQTEEKAA